MLTILIIVAVVYVTLSILLLKYPLILQKKKKVYFDAPHISHRGGAAECTENTLSAFKSYVFLFTYLFLLYLRSLSQGTNMFETDCYITKDKQIVLFHDLLLKRTTNNEGLIRDYNYDDLPKYSNKIASSLEPDVYYRNPSCSIVRLEDLFQIFLDVPVNIDLKVNDKYLLEEVGRLIQKYNREHITIWGSSSSKVHAACERYSSNISTFASIYHIFCTILFYMIGLLPFLPINYGYFEVPLISIYLSPTYLKWHNWDKPHIKLGLHILNFLFSVHLFKHLRLRGIPVYVWICNTESEFKSAFELGASGVMTDYPKRLTKFLKNNPQYPKQF